MSVTKTSASHRRLWPWLTLIAILLATALQLRIQGRLWWCTCGELFIWTSDAWGSHTSQHLFDPYSFTHMLHGIAFCGLIALTLPGVSPGWRFSLGILLEALWEVFENTEFVIQRYREATAALGYQGDSIANSLGDIGFCGVGFLIAQRLGLWRSAVVFAATELVLLLWIRDSLLLEILMLIYPIQTIKAWQVGH